MIFILRSVGLRSGLQPFFDDPNAPRIEILDYDEVLSRNELERGTYVFGDLDGLNTVQLVDAGRLYRKLRENGCRVLTDPARARKRAELLRVLYNAGLNPFNSYRADSGERPERFPVFIRVADGHTGTLTDLIPDQASLDRAIEAAVTRGVPRSVIIITEYAAEPLRSGVFRKSSLYRVGDSLVPDIWWYGENWHVKGDRDDLADPALYLEELRTFREHDYPKELEDAFALANIEFGRLDFGIVGGRVCVYEINTFPTFFGPRSHPVPEREESIRLRWKGLLAAFHAIDTEQGEARSPVDVAGVSIAALNEAHAISPALRSYHFDLSREYARRGDLAMAIAEAEAEVAITPDTTKTLSHLSRLLAKQNRHEESISASNAVLALNPRATREWHHLSQQLVKVNRYPEARERLLEALKRCGDDWKTYLLLSKISKHLGDGSAAHEYATKAAALAPDEPQITDWIQRLKGPSPSVKKPKRTVRRLLANRIGPIRARLRLLLERLKFILVLSPTEGGGHDKNRQND